MTDTTDMIAEAIIAHWGERCVDSEPGCPCCDAWAQYDAFATLRAEVERNAGIGIAAMTQAAAYKDRAEKAEAEREAQPQWQPIENGKAHALARVMVAGWQPRSAHVEGYWWWYEDMLDGGGVPLGHPEAMLFFPMERFLPTFPEPPALRKEDQSNG